MDISTVTSSTSLCLAFPASVQQGKLRKHSHVVLNSPVTTTGNTTEAPELGTPHYKDPKDVRYRGFHCRSHASHLTTLVTLCACDSSPSPQYSPTQWVTLASFPGPARSSLAVRNSLRGPGLIHHVMSAIAYVTAISLRINDVIG